MSKVWKRGLMLGALLVAISAITIYTTIDVQALSSLTHINLASLIAAFICLAIGMYFDGLRLQRLVRIGGYRLSIKAVLTVIFGNYFMAMLTPGASGGAVAQVLILKNYGIPVLKGAPIVLIRTVFSIFFLIVMLPIVFLFDSITVPYITKANLLWISLALVICAIVGLYSLQTVYMERFVLWAAKKMRSKNGEIWQGKLKELNEGFSLIYAKPWQSLIVFVESGISLIFLYAIAPSLMWAFTDHVPVFAVLGRMILLNLVLYFAPTPGGTGVAEGLFVYLFNVFLPVGTVGIVTVVWRVIAEYIPFFIGLYSVFTLYGKKFMAVNVEEGAKEDHT